MNADNHNADSTTESTNDEAAIAAIASVLRNHGELYHGGEPERVAAEWHECEFDADDVDAWCEVHCWDAETAEALRDAGLSPSDAAKAVERCRVSDESIFHDNGLNYGCPMYAACNGKYDVNNLVAAHKLDNEGYVVIASDDENNADEWWGEVRENYPDLAKALARDERVIVSGDVYESLANLPGFADGPEHAKTALRRVDNWFDTDHRSKRLVYIFAEAY